MIKASQVIQIKMSYRIASGFILFCTLIASLGLAFALITEPFHPTSIIGILVIALMLHANIKITFTGFAPSYLLFTHGKRDDT